MSRIGIDIEFEKQLLRFCGLEDVKNIQELVIKCSVSHLPQLTVTKYLYGNEDLKALETKTYKVILEEKEKDNVEE